MASQVSMVVASGDSAAGPLDTSRRRRSRRAAARAVAGLLALLLAACSGSAGQQQAAGGLPELRITVFAAPSQSIWLPALITGLKLDEKQGFRLVVTPKPGPVAYADFATGADPVCYCAAPAAVARFVEQGAQISLLWNIFDLDAYVATKDPSIRSLKDLAGKRVAADTGTGYWAVAAWLLEQNGVALSSLDLQSSSNAAAIRTELAVGRVDAAMVQPLDIATMATTPEGAGYRAIGLDRARIWHRYAATAGIPSIDLGAWRPWLQDPGHRELLKKLYRANLEAADYIKTHPEQAARLISAQTQLPEPALLYLFRHHADIIDIRPTAEYRGAIKALTQQLLPAAHLLDRPLTDQELADYVADFEP